MKQVRTGLDTLVAEGFRQLRGRHVGLLAHPASVDGSLRHVADLLAAAPQVHLVALFGPEHGWLGQAQDMESVAANSQAQGHGLRLVSLYGEAAETLRPTVEQLAGVDTLVIDLQDVGARYYTFQATMLYCLEAAHRLGLTVLVLDRPNPIGGLAVEGPALASGYESFVGPHDLAIRHGLTLGELARLYRAERRLEGCDLQVVPCQGWSRGMFFEDTGLPWVLPSPNMPSVDTAVVYPGQCLLEGTSLSEGRGTTRPFELCGAPWLEASVLAAKLNGESLPGVSFRAAWFQPAFHKWAGRVCGGVQLHVTDRLAFQPVRTSLALLAAVRDLSGEQFCWRTESYEFVQHLMAIDLLWGSARERLALEARVPWREVAAVWEAEEAAFRQRRQPYLLYS